MTFDVSAAAYERFMGRYSSPLATALLRALDVAPDARALDVGCGPGVLTARLAELLGADRVAAVDPAPRFIEAVRARLPAVDARRCRAEQLPFDDATFDLTAAQLVVPFMADPVAGLREMRRVTRPGGLLTATAWKHAADGSGPLSPFWRAANADRIGGYEESGLAGQRDGELLGLLRSAGIPEVRQLTLSIRVTHETFEEWWEPYTWGVGPAGDYVATLDHGARERLRARAMSLLGEGPILVAGDAWCAIGRA